MPLTYTAVTQGGGTATFTTATAADRRRQHADLRVDSDLRLPGDPLRGSGRRLLAREPVDHRLRHHQLPRRGDQPEHAGGLSDRPQPRLQRDARRDHPVQGLLRRGDRQQPRHLGGRLHRRCRPTRRGARRRSAPGRATSRSPATRASRSAPSPASRPTTGSTCRGSPTRSSRATTSAAPARPEARTRRGSGSGSRTARVRGSISAVRVKIVGNNIYSPKGHGVYVPDMTAAEDIAIDSNLITDPYNQGILVTATVNRLSVSRQPDPGRQHRRRDQGLHPDRRRQPLRHRRQPHLRRQRALSLPHQPRRGLLDRLGLRQPRARTRTARAARSTRPRAPTSRCATTASTPCSASAPRPGR